MTNSVNDIIFVGNVECFVLRSVAFGYLASKLFFYIVSSTMASHIDANVPSALLPFVGTLLADFKVWLLQQDSVHRLWAEVKVEGYHITP